MKEKYLLPSILCVGLFLIGNPAFAAISETQKAADPVTPVPLVYSASGTMNSRLIIVDKSSQTLRLYSSSQASGDNQAGLAAAPLTLQAMYPVILGSRQGDKRVQGDLRTPEGIYHLKRWIPGKRLPARYGIGAFTLDYPNYLDRLRGKTGNGIWIHGINPRQDKFDTKGCIALANENLTFLKKFLHPGIPVLITPKLSWGNEQQRQERFSQWRQRITDWLTAWEKGDLETFAAFYDPGYPGRRGFLANKKNVWRLYPQRALALGPIEIFLENGHEAVVRFSHMYIADNLKEWGERILYWEKNDQGVFTIVAQKWKNRGDVITNRFADRKPSENRLWKLITAAVAAGDVNRISTLRHAGYRTKKSRWSLPLASLAAAQARGATVTLSNPRGGPIGSLTRLLAFRVRVRTASGALRQGRKILVLRDQGDGFRIYRDFYYPD